MIARTSVALALLAVTGVASSQEPARRTVRVRDVGPGESGRTLAAILARPHTVVLADSARPIVFPSGTVHDSSVVVVGAGAIVSATVHGDAVAVGGDLFLRPGAVIDGRAIAIGGGVYVSALATVRGGTRSFPDNTFAATPTPGGVALDYRARSSRPRQALLLPVAYGVRVPAYDRTNGVTVPWGPLVVFAHGRHELEPLVTYRSDLGVFDPSVELRAEVTRRTTVTAAAARATASNDRWIYSDVVNSLTTLATGTDTRNYYREDLLELRVGHRWDGTTVRIEPFVGGRTEYAWSVGPDARSEGAPWSLLRRASDLGMRRLNPAVRRGRTSSALGGVRAEWQSGEISTRASTSTEVAFRSPDERRFVQTTADVSLTFPTFADQTLSFFTHGVLTSGDTAPPQRFSYLGGAGTFPTLDLLELGGDELLFVESEYTLPLRRLTIPLVGSPSLSLRYMVGGAGVATLPDLVQNVGLRVAISFLRLDVVLDPATRDTRVSAGLSVLR